MVFLARWKEGLERARFHDEDTDLALDWSGKGRRRRQYSATSSGSPGMSAAATPPCVTAASSLLEIAMFKGDVDGALPYTDPTAWTMGSRNCGPQQSVQRRWSEHVPNFCSTRGTVFFFLCRFLNADHGPFLRPDRPKSICLILCIRMIYPPQASKSNS